VSDCALVILEPVWFRAEVWQTILQPELGNALPAGNVTLTFDDGPNPYRDTTSRLLSVLRSEGVRTVFCPVGRYVSQQPELVRAIAGEGHLIANHTYHHSFLPTCSGTALQRELERGSEAILEATGAEPLPLLRPPFGIYHRRTREACRERGWGFCSLTHFHFDTLYRGSQMHRLLGRMAQDLLRAEGGVVVLHERICVDGFWRKENPRAGSLLDRAWVPDAVEQLVRSLKDEGFTFDPLPFVREMTKPERL